MIIKCPYCGRRFELQRRPPKTFCCPKCSYKVPFSVILQEQHSEKVKNTSAPAEDAPVTAGSEPLELPVSVVNGQAQSMPTSVNSGHNNTVVVEGLNGNMKTQLIPELQSNKKGILSVTYRGMSFGTIKLPYGNYYNLGRKSSDSNAQIKITPDIAMSRIHAGMRTVKTPSGQIVYQITSVKNDNPVYVNGQPIAKGKACNLKPGDSIKMGETVMIFQMV